MNTQPWVSLGNPLSHLWVRDLPATINAGFISREDVEGGVRQVRVLESLLFEIDHCFEETVLLPCAATDLEKNTIEPCCSLPQSPSSLWSNPAAAARTYLRRLAESCDWMKIRRVLVVRLPRGMVCALIAWHR